MGFRAVVAVAALMVLAGCSNAVDRTVPVTPTPPGATATPGPTPATPAPTAPIPTDAGASAIHLRGLPEQGVAVEQGHAVDLHDLFTGKLIAHLPRFRIYDPTAAPDHLILQRGHTYYLLEEFRRRLRPVVSRKAADRFTGRDQPGLDLPIPMSHGSPLTGHWRYESVDPRYGDRVLAQWSGECEVPTAFFVDRDEASVVPVTGEADPATAPESFAEGWTKRGRAVVFLPEGACAAGAEAPGVYLFGSAGEGRLLVATTGQGVLVHMWGNAIAD
jgi:hypothetical protein